MSRGLSVYANTFSQSDEARSRCLKEEVAGWADRSRMHGGAESACVACARGRIWGAAHRGAGLAEQVEGGASTLAHLGHAEAAAVAPLALEEVDLARQTPTRSRRAWLQMMTLIAIEIYKICEHIGAAICYIFTGPGDMRTCFGWSNFEAQLIGRSNLGSVLLWVLKKCLCYYHL